VSHFACPQSPPRRCFRASLENELGQRDHSHTGRGVADEQELVDPALDISLVDEGERQQQQMKQEKNEDNDGNNGQQQ